MDFELGEEEVGQLKEYLQAGLTVARIQSLLMAPRAYIIRMAKTMDWRSIEFTE